MSCQSSQMWTSLSSSSWSRWLRRSRPWWWWSGALPSHRLSSRGRQPIAPLRAPGFVRGRAASCLHEPSDRTWSWPCLLVRDDPLPSPTARPPRGSRALAWAGAPRRVSGRGGPSRDGQTDETGHPGADASHDGSETAGRVLGEPCRERSKHPWGTVLSSRAGDPGAGPGLANAGATAPCTEIGRATGRANEWQYVKNWWV